MDFLFWNIRNLSENFYIHFPRITQEYSVDILLLAECATVDDSIIAAFGFIRVKDQEKENKFSIKAYIKGNIQISKINQYEVNIEELLEMGDQTVTITERIHKIVRLSVFAIGDKDDPTYLAGIHFPSKLNLDEVKQFQIADKFKKVILEQCKNDKIIIVGDFNH